MEHWIGFFAVPLMLMKSGGAIVRMNQAARSLLSRCSVVRVPNGYLQTDGYLNSAKLSRFLEEARDRSGASWCGGICLENPESGESVSLILRAVGRRDDEEGQALLFLSDGRIEVPVHAAERIRELWGLTDAETALAASVARGVRLGRYAAESGVSANTVRSQLKSVFMKTGVRRQADLIRLVWTGPAAVGLDG